MKTGRAENGGRSAAKPAEAGIITDQGSEVRDQKSAILCEVKWNSRIHAA